MSLGHMGVLYCLLILLGVSLLAPGLSGMFRINIGRTWLIADSPDARNHLRGHYAMTAAFGISEVVDENMANAARVHAIEWGKEVSHRALIAFGGAAPLHAARLAEKLHLDQVIVPTGAGVGSAIGFLRAPIAYEVVRRKKRLLGLLGTKEERTLVSSAYSGGSRTAQELIMIDLSQWKPGGAALSIIVRITDDTTGQQVERHIDFSL